MKTALKPKILTAIAAGMTDPRAIAGHLGCSEMTVYRIAGEAEKEVSRTPRIRKRSEAKMMSRVARPRNIKGTIEQLWIPGGVLREAFGISEVPREFMVRAVGGKIEIERVA